MGAAHDSGSIVAEVTITLRSGRRGRSVLRYPSRKSMLRLRSCASSMMIVSYAERLRSRWIALSRIPSVMSRIRVSADTLSVKRT
jgi:hypothetical protein